MKTWNDLTDPQKIALMTAYLCELDGELADSRTISGRSGHLLAKAGLMIRKDNSLIGGYVQYPLTEAGRAIAAAQVTRQQRIDAAMPAVTTQGVKSQDEIISLKKEWLFDPCWDIETTSGFEAHHDELLAWRKTQENTTWKKEAARLAARAAELECSVALVRYLETLERRIRNMNEYLGE